jgi:hypothetical protein
MKDEWLVGCSARADRFEGRRNALPFALRPYVPRRATTLHKTHLMKRSLFLAALLTVLCLGLSLVLLSTAGCSTLADLHILNPSYSLVDVAPHVNLSIPPSMDFDLTVGVDNPNSVGLRLDGLDFALFVNNNRIANGTSFDRINIPARGVGNVRLRTHVTYDNLKSIYREVVDVVQGNRARYAIEGYATYDTPVGRMTLPVTIQR